MLFRTIAFIEIGPNDRNNSPIKLMISTSCYRCVNLKLKFNEFCELSLLLTAGIDVCSGTWSKVPSQRWAEMIHIEEIKCKRKGEPRVHIGGESPQIRFPYPENTHSLLLTRQLIRHIVVAGSSIKHFDILLDKCCRTDGFSSHSASSIYHF